MKKVALFAALLLSLTVGSFAQEAKKPTDDDKNAAIPATGFLKRGAAIGSGEKASLNAVLKDPSKYAGKPILVEGVVVRSCKAEGCWAEVAENKDSKSVRVKMKSHAFFIPLQSAGSTARIEGTVQLKTLSKEQVDHMINDDGAKFDNRNADGTVTEVSFEATGIELQKKGS